MKSVSLLPGLLALLLPTLLHAAADIVIADFEGDTYGDWKTTGTAFTAAGPAHGTLPHQMRGRWLCRQGTRRILSTAAIAACRHTDAARVSPRAEVDFLSHRGWRVGGKDVPEPRHRWQGGPHGDRADYQARRQREATLPALAGTFTEPTGRTAKTRSSWMTPPAAQGHINVDQIVQTDTAPPVAAKLVANVSREIVATQRWLNFPVKTGADKRVVTVSVDGQPMRKFDIELADSAADWWAPLDVSAWAGKKLAISVDKLPEKSTALDALRQSDDLLDAANLYRQAAPAAAPVLTPPRLDERPKLWPRLLPRRIPSLFSNTIPMAGIGAICTGAMPPVPIWCIGGNAAMRFIPMTWGRCSAAAPWSIGKIPAAWGGMASRRSS